MVHFFRKKEDEEKNPSGCVYEKVVKSVRSIHSIENGKIVLFSCFSQSASNIHTLKCALFLSSSPCKQIIIIQSKTWFNWIRNWIFTSSLMESERKKRKGWFISIVIKRTRAHTHQCVVVFGAHINSSPRLFTHRAGRAVSLCGMLFSLAIYKPVWVLSRQN